MTQRLASETVVIAAPMSFAGSAARAWKLTRLGPGGLKVLTGPLALALIVVWWAAICVWYVVFGLLVVPYRLIRRGSRKQKRDNLRHREMLDATNGGTR